MNTVTIRELRHHGGDVVARVQAGEHLLVTRAGQPVAELRPIARQPLDAHSLLAIWRNVPVVDEVAFRRDVDGLIDQTL